VLDVERSELGGKRTAVYVSFAIYASVVMGVVWCGVGGLFTAFERSRDGVRGCRVESRRSDGTSACGGAEAS